MEWRKRRREGEKEWLSQPVETSSPISKVIHLLTLFYVLCASLSFCQADPNLGLASPFIFSAGGSHRVSWENHENLPISLCSYLNFCVNLFLTLNHIAQAASSVLIHISQFLESSTPPRCILTSDFLLPASNKMAALLPYSQLPTHPSS